MTRVCEAAGGGGPLVSCCDNVCLFGLPMPRRKSWRVVISSASIFERAFSALEDSWSDWELGAIKILAVFSIENSGKSHASHRLSVMPRTFWMAPIIPPNELIRQHCLACHSEMVREAISCSPCTHNESSKSQSSSTSESQGHARFLSDELS